MGSRAPSTMPPRATAGVAQMRARHPQTLLQHAKVSAPSLYPTITARLGHASVSAVEDAIPMAWLPIELDIAVVEAISAHVGPATMATLIENRQREEMGSTLFNGFVRMALQIFGASPIMMVKRIPTGWEHLFRNVGTVEVVSAVEHHGELRFRALPHVCVASAPWMAALPIGLRMLYEIVGVKGTVTCHIENASAGDALLVFDWR